jgi:hypothetical protein
MAFRHDDSILTEDSRFQNEPEASRDPALSVGGIEKDQIKSPPGTTELPNGRSDISLPYLRLLGKRFLHEPGSKRRNEPSIVLNKHCSGGAPA